MDDEFLVLLNLQHELERLGFSSWRMGMDYREFCPEPGEYVSCSCAEAERRRHNLTDSEPWAHVVAIRNRAHSFLGPRMEHLSDRYLLSRHASRDKDDALRITRV